MIDVCINNPYDELWIVMIVYVHLYRHKSKNAVCTKL